MVVRERREMGADDRTSIQLAEQERRGGIANRVSPMISMSLCFQSFHLRSSFRRSSGSRRGILADNRSNGRSITIKQSRIHNDNSRC